MSFKKVYDAEFKFNTIQLILKNKMRVIDVSRDLGIGKSTLQKWLYVTLYFYAKEITIRCQYLY